MGDAVMELSSEQKDFFGNFISGYIRENLKVWITESASRLLNVEKEMDIRERIIRVEESLDKHIALTKQGFEQMDKRFEQVDKRFNQMFAYFTTGIVILGLMITAFNVF